MTSLNFTGINTFGGLVKFTNSAVDNVLMNGAMVVFFVIIIVLYLKGSDNPDFESALTLTSWGMFLVSAFLWIGEFVDGVIPLLFLILSAFGTFYLYASKR